MTDKRSPETIRFDRWDLEDWQQLREEIEALPAAAAALLKITPTARAQLFDAYNAFAKNFPDRFPEDQIRPDHLVNLAVINEAETLQEFTHLRRFTKGDPVGSAMAVVSMEPVFEELHDKHKLLQRQADQLQELHDQLEQKLQELLDELAKQPQLGEDEGDDEPGESAATDEGGGEGEGSGEGGDQEGEGQGQGQQPSQQAQDLQQEIEDLQRAIDAVEKALENGVKQAKASMRSKLAKGMDEAAAERQLERTIANMCGLDPGKLVRLPVKERLELARKFNQHSDLAEIAKHFGAVWNEIISERYRTVDGIPHEIYDITLGRDLSRLTPSELIRLDDDDLVWDFLKDFSEGRVRNYKVRGKETVGRGGVVMCEDGSLSMVAFCNGSTREMVAKAVMAGVANVARIEGRSFHLVHFGGPGMFETLSFVQESDWTVDRLIEALEIFFCGGTDFATPLNEAVRLLEEEHDQTGHIQSDIVFLTDGYAGLSEEFLEDFLGKMHALEAQAHGVCLGNEPDVHISEPMNTFCEGRVYSLDDLSNNGKELRSIYRRL